jgi:hypothetical protein
LDNRKNNLRIVNKAQQQQNRKVQYNSSTGFSGVDFHKDTEKYQSRLSYNGKRYHIGLFKTIKEAKKARDKKLKELSGE